jgi:hypothetical protein
MTLSRYKKICEVGELMLFNLKRRGKKIYLLCSAIEAKE